MSGHPKASARADVYTRVTSEIIAAIESGAGSWRMPWHHHGNAIARPTNLASHKRYRGINVLALWIAADAAQYSDGVWGTYRQWGAAGGQVRKGERATTVVLWKEYRTAQGDEDGEDDDGQRSQQSVGQPALATGLATGDHGRQEDARGKVGSGHPEDRQLNVPGTGHVEGQESRQVEAEEVRELGTVVLCSTAK